jgi:hypothetical protein
VVDVAERRSPFKKSGGNPDGKRRRLPCKDNIKVKIEAM